METNYSLPATYRLSTGEEVSDENWEQFCQDFLGEGYSRRVYALDENTVLKVMFEDPDKWGQYGCNLDEALKWCEVRDHPDREYFAEVRAIGTGGWWMVMERADEVGYWLTPEVQNYICDAWKVWDLHDENVGRFRDGTHKAIDYCYPWPFADDEEYEDAMG